MNNISTDRKFRKQRTPLLNAFVFDCNLRKGNQQDNCRSKYRGGCVTNQIEWCKVCHSRPGIVNIRENPIASPCKQRETNISDKSSLCRYVLKEPMFSDTGSYHIQCSQPKHTGATHQMEYIRHMENIESEQRKNRKTNEYCQCILFCLSLCKGIYQLIYKRTNMPMYAVIYQYSFVRIGKSTLLQE